MRTAGLLLLVALVTLLAACGTSSPATDAATLAPDAFASGDGGGPIDAGRDATIAIDTGSAPTDSGEPTYMLPDNYCFTFATATSMDSMSMTCGDMLALVGINVDLDSTNGFCPQTGTYTSLASVPRDYTSCAWTSYVEGGSPLADTGYIVRDAAGVHHYRMRILSNLHPALIFSFDTID